MDRAASTTTADSATTKMTSRLEKLDLGTLLSSLPKRETVAFVNEKGIRVVPSASSKNNSSKSSSSPLVSLIPPSWRTALRSEFTQPYFARLESAVVEAYNDQTAVYPPKEQLFRALELVPLDAVRVVILGQEPHVRAGQAHGLAFSTTMTTTTTTTAGSSSISLPPSLTNIVKELESEYDNDFKMLQSGDLSGWASQGVLLLNSVLSVAHGEPNSHSEFGWRTLTDRIVQLVAQRAPSGVVFMLWGAAAKEKASLIEGGASHHHVLRAAHPSPKTAECGFFGCGHFVRCNQLLAARNSAPIEWGVRRGGAPLKHKAPQQSSSSLATFGVETTLTAEYDNVIGTRASSLFQNGSGGRSACCLGRGGAANTFDDEYDYELEDPAEEQERQRLKRATTSELFASAITTAEAVAAEEEKETITENVPVIAASADPATIEDDK